ncbi:MAG: hypothetical protein NVSMB27_21810 [Ktedonobacteraceae bacterium]
MAYPRPMDIHGFLTEEQTRDPNYKLNIITKWPYDQSGGPQNTGTQP